jgi:hypothetical protein
LIRNRTPTHLKQRFNFTSNYQPLVFTQYDFYWKCVRKKLDGKSCDHSTSSFINMYDIESGISRGGGYPYKTTNEKITFIFIKFHIQVNQMIALFYDN